MPQKMFALRKKYGQQRVSLAQIIPVGDGVFQATVTNDFLMNYDIVMAGMRGPDIEQIEDAFRREYEKEHGVTEIADLGDFPLWARVEHEEITSVHLSRYQGHNTEILAKDVPKGTFIRMEGANSFFRTYKGESAIDESGYLVR